jgi:tetratricopeptide (TPR) repeat protein
MKTLLLILLSGFFVVFATAAVLGQSSESELNLGVEAYKNAKFKEAIEHLQRSVADDSSNLRARLYLATALAEQYIPGADTRDNHQVGEQAVREFEKVLELEPAELKAVKGVGYLLLQMKQFEEARNFYQRAIEIQPDDPESYYSIGVIDWTETYALRMKTRAKLHLKPEGSFIGFVQCLKVREANLALVADGMEKLKAALERRPDYDDAMAYMNLMYRERADIQCGDRRARAADLKAADKWVDLTIGTKKNKAEKHPAEEESDSR